jgi:hypothetical protein
MDVTQLSRRAAPNGVLLIFELLLQHFPPSADAAAAAAAPPAGAPCGGGGGGGAGAAAGAAACSPGRAVAAPVVVQQHAWKDNVSVLGFSLDGRRVEVVVDTSGRWVAAVPRRGGRAWGGVAAAPAARPLLQLSLRLRGAEPHTCAPPRPRPAA